MQEFKVCFVGSGSIARRHVRNLRDICRQRGIALTVDAYRSGENREKPEGVDRQFFAPDHLPDDYDALFITNPTQFHLRTLSEFHDRARHFFIEKPLVSISQLDEAKRFQRRADAVYYVACPLRYNAVIQFIRANVDPDDVLSVRSISSSYLPDWRPGQDYRNTYSSHRNLGGGVSIDLIHEWDYLTYLFGIPEKVCCMIGKISGLEIDSDDYAIYIAEMDRRIIELHLDYFGRKTMREIQLFTREDTIVGDLVENRIRWLKSGRTVDFHENRDDFQQRELAHFLDLISGKAAPGDDYRHAIQVLNLTQGITG